MKLSLFLSTIPSSLAANPLVPNSGMADTNVHYFNGTFLAFATHDFSENNTVFRMKDWQTWTSTDLVNWELASTVDPNTVFPAWGQDKRNSCWATDAALVDDKYYFYVSVGEAEIGGLQSDSPHGPWEDALGGPLLSDAQGKALSPQTIFRDPAVFKDDDGEHYLIAGVFNYYIAKLTKSMTAFAEPLRYVEVKDPFGPCDNVKEGKHTTDDKPFIHRNNDTYYLSWGCFYATSSSVYGPYQTQGSVIDRASIDEDFRMPLDPSQLAWYKQEDYTDRHGSFLQHQGQWFFASNDRSHSGDPNPAFYRNTVMCYVHFRANGTMAPCQIDATGVGQYEAARTIQAENFFASKFAAKLDLRAFGVPASAEGDGGFAVAAGTSFLSGGEMASELTFPHVRGVRAKDLSALRIRAAHGGDGVFELSWRIEADEAAAVSGVCEIDSTGSWTTYLYFDCKLKPRDGVLPDANDFQLQLGFGGDLLHVDAFALESSNLTTSFV